MDFELGSLHKLSLYVVVLVAFLCVAIGGGSGPIMAAVFMTGLGVSWWADRHNLISASAGRWFNVAILAFVAWTIFEVTMTDTPIIDAAIRFVLVLVLIKLFGRFEARDDLQIYALSLLIFAAATAVNQGVTYGLLFGVYVLAGTLSLALFHLLDESRKNREGLDTGRTPFNRQYASVLAILSLAIFGSSLIIFLTFPRVGLGFFVQQQREGVNVTGFSESVELGSHGVLRDNPQVVMRVEFPDGKPDQYASLHWRTMTLDFYDGQRWRQSLDRDERTLPGRRNAFSLDEGVPETMRLAQRDLPEQLQIYLEPMGTNLLPRLWPTQEIALGDSQNPISIGPNSGSVTVDIYADLRHTIENDIGVPYRLRTAIRPRRADLRTQAQRDPWPAELERVYLQLPEVSDRLRNLAQTITADAPTPFLKAEAVRDHLEQNYSYTTDLPPVDDRAPVDSFLFDTRRGHCEYFATAAVLLLRASGVPARLVNGFLGGTWNEVGGYLGVRQGDAHSWIEVWVPSVGWAPLDPTPAAEVIPRRANPLVQWSRDAYDAMRLTWMKWVIEYDLSAQIEFFRQAGQYLMPRGLMQDTDDTDEAGDREQPDLPTRELLFWFGLGGLGAAAFFTARQVTSRRGAAWGLGLTLLWPPVTAGWVVWFQGFQWDTASFGGAAGFAAAIAGSWLGAAALQAPRARLRRLFDRIEDAAAQRGHPRRRDEGPGHYLQRISGVYPDLADDVSLFRSYYLRARFRDAAPSLQVIGRLEAAARRIQRAIKKA